MLAPIIADIERAGSIGGTQITEALEMMMRGECSTGEIESFLIGIKDLPLTAEVLAAGARVMRRFAVKLPQERPESLDTCGTGGDFSGSINVSTLAAIVLAAGGVAVAKHGNRSNSGVCGSADLLEGLGARIDLAPERVLDGIDRIRFGFMFAPLFHPAMRFAGEARRRLRHKTIFNLMGPLSNPAGVRYQTVGIFDAALVPVYLEALRELGTVRAMVFCGHDGMDEISLSAPTLIGRLEDGRISTEIFDPLSLPIIRSEPQSIKVKTREDAIKQAADVLGGCVGDSQTAIVALNAAAGFYIKNVCRSIEDGYRMAQELLLKGKANEKLKEIIEDGKRG
ncbi:MAG: anthranilate phosphoribosyltransferase [Candidatus Omnitrophota bacterium]